MDTSDFSCKTCTTEVEQYKIEREAEEVVVFTRKITVHNSLYQNCKINRRYQSYAMT